VLLAKKTPKYTSVPSLLQNKKTSSYMSRKGGLLLLERERTQLNHKQKYVVSLK